MGEEKQRRRGGEIASDGENDAGEEDETHNRRELQTVNSTLLDSLKTCKQFVRNARRTETDDSRPAASFISYYYT